jgi:hypothetical protein
MKTKRKNLLVLFISNISPWIILLINIQSSIALITYPASGTKTTTIYTSL